MSNLVDSTRRFLKHNSSTILTCVGAAGVIVTAVSAVKATPKAVSIIAKTEKEKQDKLTKWETVKVAGPAYIPSVMIGISTIACIFGANILNKHAQASLVSAYALLDNTYKEYKDKVKEICGEDSHKKVVNAICEGRRATAEDLIETRSDKKLFFDFFSLQFFDANFDDIRIAEQYLNSALNTVGYVSLGDFYEVLGIEATDVDCALGWSRRTCDGVELIVELSNKDESGNEHYILSMSTEPSPNYWY